MSNRKLSGVALAAAAAMMFSAVSVTANAADEGKVKCEGVNGCKGQAECSSGKNSCQGKNSCKGQGWVKLTKAECDAAKAKAKAEKDKAAT